MQYKRLFIRRTANFYPWLIINRCQALYLFTGSFPFGHGNSANKADHATADKHIGLGLGTLVLYAQFDAAQFNGLAAVAEQGDAVDAQDKAHDDEHDGKWVFHFDTIGASNSKFRS
jgi:hypothetical protein